MSVLERGFFAREVTDVARDLVGARLLVAGAGTIADGPTDDAGSELSARRPHHRRPPPALRRPGRLCQALGVTGALDGLALDTAPFAIALRPAPVEIVVGPRIGITRAVDTPWRFGLRGSPFLSRPFGHGPRS